MLNLTKQIITLSIGSTFLRILTIRGKRIEKWASAPLEPGLLRDGMISDPPEVGASIKRLMEASGIAGKKIIVCQSGLYSVCRFFNIPVLEGKLNEEAVLQAAKAVISVPEEKFYFTWRVVGVDEFGQRVFVVGLPRDIVDSTIQALRSVGYNPYILKLRALALASWVNWPKALVICMELDSVDIVIVIDGIPVITHTLCQRENLSLEEQIDYLANAVERVLNFCRAINSAIALDADVPLFLVGQLADNPQVVGMIQERLQNPLAPLSMPLEHSSNLPISQFAVNVGLALGQIPLLQRVDDE